MIDKLSPAQRKSAFRQKLAAQSADLLATTTHDVRFDLGVHKATKLRQALGRRAKSTLLHSDTARTHTQRLYDKFRSRWGKLSQADAQRRLRFLTVLHEVIALHDNPDAVTDSVERMKRKIADAFSRVKGRVTLLGAVEIEVVNIPLMRRQASTANEQRKLNVLTKMTPSIRNTVYEAVRAPAQDRPQFYLLVHLHGIVDLGAHPDITESQLTSILRREWKEPYQVELKALFENRTLHENLNAIAAYLTKGGNKDLRYNIRFGNDDPDALDGRIWRSGMGRKDVVGEDGAMEDAKSLTLAEIKVLGAAYDLLMGRTHARDGYVLEVPRKAVIRKAFRSRRRRSAP